MPQMMPIYWVMIFTLNLFVLLIVILLIGSSSTIKIKNVKIIKFDKSDHNDFMTKWK